MSKFPKSFLRWSVFICALVGVGIVAFELLEISVFKKVGFAHAYCYLRDPKMIWLHVVSDVLIGAAYVSISTTLGYLVWRASENIPFHWVFLAFGLFIVSCGFTHFMEVLVVWQPLYWLAGYVKVVTAAASLATAIALFPLVPKVFSLIDEVKKADARRKRIEVLNEELESFTSSVAHDLRAPLRAISGMTVALQEDYSDKLDDRGRDYARRIVASAQKMDRLILDLLSYSRVTSEQLQLSPVDLNRALAETQAALAHDIQATNAVLTVQSTLGVVRASQTLLQQILVNLVSNALKFVPAGRRPEIVITSQLKGDFVHVCIADNGIGIPAQHQERIFRIFERLSTDYAGTGVGLAIVHKAAQRMGGRVGVESREGAGTTFWIDLPKA